ncbi:MAG TPA: substrate-binding domain-containing protein [Vicinamibacterales bacterium]|nr:substrate-binding domain-containing protein [Vicinamibacterales bacterium]
MTSMPLQLISSMATRAVLRELAALCQDATGQAVHTEAAGGVDVAKRVRAGAAPDVVVLASDVIDALIAEGHLRPGRMDLVKSGVAVAVRAGAARPDIASEEALRQAVLSSATLSYSTGPSGAHLEKTFERWGVLAEIRGRIVVPPPGTPVGTLVADGRAALGFQQLSELATLPGIDVVGPLPPDVQILTVFSGAVATRCDRPDAARAVLDFMASPAAADVIRRHWMDPAVA